MMHTQDPFARGRDRVRHAWGSLRERLGLRGTNSNNNASSGDGNGQPRLRPDGTPMDAREVMLAEMARAFNLGLGLSGDGAGEPSFVRGGHEVGDRDRDRDRERDRASGSSAETAPQSATGNDQSVARPQPAEDSFERFLMDLQSELRVVLSAPANDGEENTPHATSTSGGSSAEESSSILPTTTTTTGAPSEIGEGVLPTPGDIPVPGVDTQDGIEVEIHDEAEEEEEVPITPTTDSDMPSLMDIPTNSIFPFPLALTESIAADEGEDETTPRPSTSTSATATPPGAQASSTHRASTGTETRTANGGINWWRLYRFPPITSPQGMPAAFAAAAAAAAAATSAQVSSAPGSGDASVPQGTASSTSSSAASSESDAPPDAQRETAATVNTVIPVIVVGLQSVNTNRRRDREPGSRDAREQRHEDADGSGNDGIEDDVEFDGFPGLDGGDSEHGDTQTRGRRWHSRAANAIRNLRPGRRPTPGRSTASEGLGSRTFLIYVIGGGFSFFG